MVKPHGYEVVINFGLLKRLFDELEFSIIDRGGVFQLGEIMTA